MASEINSYHSEEYGTATYKGELEQINLHVTLRKPSYPPGVTVSLVLQQAQGKVQGIERFLANAEKYESLALSVPWLSKYMKDNPRVAVRISYVQDRSFGHKAVGRSRRTCNSGTDRISLSRYGHNSRILSS
ncbi:MAG: hypothetical protein IPP47_29415 [Bryobacterales bacterium]|nr:hypothetical protein [Bryobacterales bacterium]